MTYMKPPLAVFFVALSACGLKAKLHEDQVRHLVEREKLLTRCADVEALQSRPDDWVILDSCGQRVLYTRECCGRSCGWSRSVR